MTTRVTDEVGPDTYEAVFDIDPDTTVDVTLGLKEGRVLVDGVLTVIAANTYALNPSAINIVYIDLDDGPPVVKITTSVAKPQQLASTFLWIVTTSATEILDTLDLRNWSVGQVHQL